MSFRLLDFLFGGPVKRPPLPVSFDLPMIFNNGVDLDDAGVIAFCEGKAVNLWGERTLAAGEAYQLSGRFRLAAHGLVICHGTTLRGVFGCTCCARPALVLDMGKMGKRRLLFRSLEFDGGI
jgi:hypothetical protein